MREAGVRENIGGTMEWLSLTTRALLRERSIYLVGEIEESMAHDALLQLRYLSGKDGKEPITIWINSPGGEIDEGLMLYDAIRACPCPVRTIATGRALSMGGFLLGAGTRGQRFATPHARIMLHQPSAGTRGKVSDMEINLELFIRARAELNALLAQHTGKTAEELHALTEKDLWLNPAEAISFGLIDGIWTGEAAQAGKDGSGKGEEKT